MKLQNKLSGLVLLLVGTVVFFIGVMVVGSEKSLLNSEFKNHQNELVKQLAKVYEESLYQNELLFFNYVRELKSERGFVSAFFVDNAGRILIHSDPAQIGMTSTSPNEKEMIGLSHVFRQSYRLNGKTEILELAFPVWFGNTRAGTVRLLLDEGVLQQFMKGNLTRIVRKMVWISLLALLLGFIGAFVLARTIVSPIERIVEGMRDVAEGKLDPIPELARKDELGWVTKELNITIHKLKELDEMKREFIASVTHEFRSPLTAIESFLSLLIKGTYGPLTSEQKESMLTIKNNTIRLASFVDDLLTMAKLEAKKMDVFMSSFDLCEVAKNTERLFSSLARDHQLTLKLNLPSEPLMVYSDQKKITQILSNLVSNAIKFTPSGFVAIRVGRNERGPEVSVIDSGVGIPEQDKIHIFEKFYRSSHTSAATKGTGLGLAIVKEYSEILGTNIGVADHPGGGTVFSLQFPPKA